MLLTTENIILIGALLLLVSVFAGKVAYRFGAPALLLFLGVGMLFGLRLISFNSAPVAQFVGMVALCIILFSGGMDTRYRAIRPVIGPGVVLAAVGVALTALNVAGFVYVVAPWCNAEMSFLLALLFAVNLCSGSVRLSPSQVLGLLLGQEQNPTAWRILWEIRLPRCLAAVVLGGALSVSGFLLQTFLANPIAGPYILGISSGAKMTVCVAMLVLLSRGKTTSSAILIAAAFVGAMVSMGFVLLISQRVKRMSLLVVCGVMIGYICSALTDFLVTFADDSSIVNLHNWALGAFSGMSWDNVKTMAVVCSITLLLTFLLSKPIRAYQLGEVYAQNMGVPLRAFRTALILLSSVLSACVTAFAGPISFVGIAVPHLMKSLFKSAEPLCMIPACFLGGGVFCLFCDLIARTAFAPTEVSISSVTAVFGAPIVIYMMIHRKAA